MYATCNYKVYKKINLGNCNIYRKGANNHRHRYDYDTDAIVSLSAAVGSFGNQPDNV